MTAVAHRSALDGLRALRGRRVPALELDGEPDVLTPWALDPKLPLLEGRIKVWDPARLAFVTFAPWPHQLELLDAWIDTSMLGLGPAERAIRFRNVHVEKSRQMGDTVALAYGCLWTLTYHDAPLLMQHQNFGEVDDGGAAATWDSFFGKIRLMHSAWPDDIGRARLRFKGGGDPLISNLDHPFRFLTGEGATPDPGRGGRYAGGVIDEAARIVYGEQAQAALSRAIPVGRALLSTPDGEGNMYFRIRTERPAGWRFARHHWTSHPDYAVGLHVAGDDPDCELCRGNVQDLRWDPHDPRCHRYPGKPTSPWYDQAVVELTDEQVAAELDIDYTASLSARVYPGFSEDHHVAAAPIEYAPDVPISTAWDYGLDTTAVLILQNHPNELRLIGEWEGHDLAPEENVAGVLKVLRALGVEARLLEPRWTSTTEAVGDPSGDNREVGSAMSIADQYRRHGFNIHAPQQLPVATTVFAVKRLLLGRPKPLVVSPSCWRTVAHFKGNVWPTDKQGVRKPNATQPVDNEHNHAMRALAYFVAHKWPVPDLQLPPPGGERPPANESGRLTDVTYGMKF